MTDVTVAAEALYLLLLALGVAIVLAVALAAALRSARRRVREAGERLSVMIDPREDLITMRLKRLEFALAGLPPVVLRRDPPR